MLIMRILLAINPTITSCLIQGLAVSDQFFAGILFANAQQDAIRLAMVFRKPGSEITRRCEAHYFHHNYSTSTSSTKTRDCWAPFAFSIYSQLKSFSSSEIAAMIEG